MFVPFSVGLFGIALPVAIFVCLTMALGTSIKAASLVVNL